LGSDTNCPCIAFNALLSLVSPERAGQSTNTDGIREGCVRPWSSVMWIKPGYSRGPWDKSGFGTIWGWEYQILPSSSHLRALLECACLRVTTQVSIHSPVRKWKTRFFWTHHYKGPKISPRRTPKIIENERLVCFVSEGLIAPLKGTSAIKEYWLLSLLLLLLRSKARSLLLLLMGSTMILQKRCSRWAAIKRERLLRRSEILLLLLLRSRARKGCCY